MARIPVLLLALALFACGKDPDLRRTDGESKVTAKAVADVDAAMAEARRAKALPPPVPETTPAATTEAQ